LIVLSKEQRRRTNKSRFKPYITLINPSSLVLTDGDQYSAIDHNRRRRREHHYADVVPNGGQAVADTETAERDTAELFRPRSNSFHEEETFEEEFHEEIEIEETGGGGRVGHY
jgi:hypothetical protein